MEPQQTQEQQLYYPPAISIRAFTLSKIIRHRDIILSFRQIDYQQNNNDEIQRLNI